MKSPMSAAAAALAMAAMLAAPAVVTAEAKAGGSTEPAPLKVKLGGAYAIWGLNQHGFLLGRDHPLDDADYVVQMFRLALKVQKGAVGGFLRMDAAQGWWGVDNSPNVMTTVSQDSTTKDVTAATKYNRFALFRNKDTNYPVHVDRAYIFMNDPLGLPVHGRIGRQGYVVGNRIVLDVEYEGLTLRSHTYGPVTVSGFWAKMSEGKDSTKAPAGKLMSDDGANEDADLYGAIIDYKRKNHRAQLYGLAYQDRAATDKNGWAFLPQGYGYFRARFQPQVSSATVFGLNAKGRIDLLEGLLYNVEFDYLAGRDDIANQDYAGNLIDKNNGDLQGFNVYAKLTQKLRLGIPLDVSLLFGMGSGDDDVSGGKGNINKIQTQGFFGLTNVWEDSVMPDIGGISPQGLGSPVSRGYRELENTTAIQVKLGLNPHPKARLEASYTLLKATQAIHGWDAKGPTADSAEDIGSEIDVNLKLKLLPGLKYVALFGYFQSGDAARYLINGNLKTDRDAWELKQVLLYKF